MERSVKGVYFRPSRVSQCQSGIEIVYAAADRIEGKGRCSVVVYGIEMKICSERRKKSV